MTRIANYRLRRWLAIALVSSLSLAPACAKSGGGDDDLLMLVLLLFYINQTQCTLLSATASDGGLAADGHSVSGADYFDYLERSATLAMPAGPLKSGMFMTPSGAQTIRYREENGVAFFGGDMRLPMSRLLSGGAGGQASVGVRSSAARWPTQVPYVFKTGGDVIADETDVRNAMAHWEQHTTFRFIARTGEANYISFQADGTGCYSYVGMIGGLQEVNVDAGCGFGAAVHEIGHALGLYHEQSRSDRDSYVTIDYSNIQGGFASNYDIASGSMNLGTYDFTSIMHYGSYYFAANPNTPVMTKKDGSVISPNRSALTSCDVRGVNTMYGL